ncbi:MAG: iron-containing alcohol dehydrogenase family protein [Clostridiales bacterium]|nr:iron-containing alcohol dehydrogenase family protein [Clostridiales bacterium]
MLDEAIKFGAGRYRQGRGVLDAAGEEICRFGKKLYIIAGERAFEASKARLLPSLERAGLNYTVTVYTGFCSYEAAKKLAYECRLQECDEVVGVGGGKIMDLAKAVAETAGVGVYNIPTSAATCAAFTCMSIMYTEEGAYLDNWRYEHEVDGVLADVDVIAKCPARYAASGIIDAMAKWIEIPNGKPEMRLEDTRYDIYTAYCMSAPLYQTLHQLGRQAIEDICHCDATRAVEYLTFMNIAVTGNVANITRSFGQSALAHTVYYGIRTLFPEAIHALHGEIVGVGLLLQLAYNSNEKEVGPLKEYMKALDLPLTLKELGIAETKEALDRLEGYLAGSSFVEGGRECRERLHKAIDFMVSDESGS